MCKPLTHTGTRNRLWRGAKALAAHIGPLAPKTASKGRYAFSADGGPQAELTFSKAGERIVIIDHTDVPAFYRGKGVGVKLVERAVADARAAGKKIVPLCPFAAAQFRRRPHGRRSGLGTGLLLQAHPRRRRQKALGTADLLHPGGGQ
jgi:predicted GNAT family acetyltransferase